MLHKRHNWKSITRKGDDFLRIPRRSQLYTSIVLEYSKLKYIAHERANLSFKSLYGDHVISEKKMKKKSTTEKFGIIAILKYTSGVNI